MKIDIYQKVERDFGPDLKLAMEKIDTLDVGSESFISDRVLRAVVFLANGNMERLEQVIKLGSRDYRDVLWQAEYDCGGKKLYDFNKTFQALKLIED